MSRLPPLAPGASLRWDVVSRLLPDAVDVLEIGCGLGAVGVRLAERYRYLGLEPDPTSYATAAARLGAAGSLGKVRNSDLSGLEDDERFDLVCAFEVLEHIEDDSAALAGWVDRLRPGGWLVLSTPAHQARLGPWDAIVGHYRRYDPPDLAELLRVAGLVDAQIVLYGMPLGYLLEAGRNLVGRRRQAAEGTARHGVTGEAMAERTSGSGRLLQPTSLISGTAVSLATRPFQLIQRAFPTRGPALVARARKPKLVS